MNKNRITIGRNPESDILVPDNWQTVSFDHAEILFQDGHLYFIDHSSNGTVINGRNYQDEQVEIRERDDINLANAYNLSWKTIRGFFPAHRPTVVKRRPLNGSSDDSGRCVTQSDRMSGRFQAQNNSHTEYSDRLVSEHRYSKLQIEQELKGWSWGGFFCSWLFAVCHKVYWPLLVLLVAFVPYVGQVCSLFLSVYMGLNGRKIAWSSGKYKSFDHFKKVQNYWAIGGIICFISYVAVLIFSLSITLSLI